MLVRNERGSSRRSFGAERLPYPDPVRTEIAAQLEPLSQKPRPSCRAHGARDARHELVGAPRRRDSRLRSPSGRRVQGSRDILFLWVLCKCLWVAPVLPSRIVVSVAVCWSLVSSISLHCLFIVLCLNTCLLFAPFYYRYMIVVDTCCLCVK